MAKYPLCFFLLILFSLFGILQCQKTQKPVDSDLVSVKKNIFETNASFLNQIKELENLVAENAGEKTLQQKFDALRITTKKWNGRLSIFFRRLRGS